MTGCIVLTHWLWLQAEDENGQKMTDEELWEDVHDIMGAGAAAGHPVAS